MPDAEQNLRLTGSSREEAEIARRDQALVRGVLAGDAHAFQRLIDHYDRLVRYAIFHGFKTHCARDPSFLDARASEVWSGFVESIRRAGSAPGGTLKAYLTRIARNKCSDYLRRARRDPAAPAAGGTDAPAAEQPVARDADPLATLIDFEQIEVLRRCIDGLPQSDRNLLQELDLITNSRWSEAARRLEMAESTLRSRWDRLVTRLRTCVEKNLPEIPESFAPRGPSGD